jgi:hypothetical protein
MPYLTDGQTGDFDSLIINALDTNDEPLVWTLKKTQGANKVEYWEATGTDGMIYTVTDNTSVTARPGIVNVEAV